MSGGVYAITNETTGRMYVGSTNSTARRKQEHFYQLRQKRHINQSLQREFDEFGEGSFTFTVLVECDKKSAEDIEQVILDACYSGGMLFNASPLVSGGRDRSKMASMRENISKRFHGHKHSAETKRRMSDIRTGTRRSNATREKMQKSNAMNIRVEVDGVVYESMAEASRSLGIKRTTLTSRVNSPYFESYRRAE